MLMYRHVYFNSQCRCQVRMLKRKCSVFGNLQPPMNSINASFTLSLAFIYLSHAFLLQNNCIVTCTEMVEFVLVYLSFLNFFKCYFLMVIYRYDYWCRHYFISETFFTLGCSLCIHVYKLIEFVLKKNLIRRFCDNLTAASVNAVSILFLSLILRLNDL